MQGYIEINLTKLFFIFNQNDNCKRKLIKIIKNCSQKLQNIGHKYNKKRISIIKLSIHSPSPNKKKINRFTVKKKSIFFLTEVYRVLKQDM